MKTFKPAFFDKFYCIADKCDFTCCRDWNIEVDEDTLGEWENMDIPCKCKLSTGKLTDYVEDGVLILNEDMKCHYLNENGLCNIVLEYGEEALGYACHTFPKVTYDYTTRSEYTLNLGCKFAVEKLLEGGEFNVIEGEEDLEEDDDLVNMPECIFDLRDYLLDCTKDDSINNILLLKTFMHMITELNEQYEPGESLSKIISDCIENNIFKEFRDKVLEQGMLIDNNTVAFYEHNDLLIDMLDEYLNEEMYSEYINEIYEMARKILRIKAKNIIGKVDGFYGEFRNLVNDRIRLIIQNEIYGFIIPSDEDYLNGMMRKLEWLTMEIVALEQWLFVIWDKEGELTKEDFITATAVLFRITGFSDEDIDEYLGSEYVSDIWNMDYIDLICN